MFEDAAKQVLESLVPVGHDSKLDPMIEQSIAPGLWNILTGSCLIFQRSDLVPLCSKMDLHGCFNSQHAQVGLPTQNYSRQVSMGL